MPAIHFAQRFIAGAFFAFATLFLSFQLARAATDAEQFTQGLIDKGLAILRDGGSARSSQFHQFALENLDVRKTALFALGSYKRNASEADVDAFVNAFRDYITAVYEVRLDEQKDKSLKVVNSLENKPGDVTVNSETTGGREPVKIAFRLMGSSGNYKVVDVQVAGIWISIEQHDQFASMLSKNNGDVKALTAHLVAQTQRMHSAPRA